MKNFIKTIFVIFIIPIILEATTIDARFFVQVNNGTNYDVKVQIKTNTGTDDLGTANFFFTFDNTNLSYTPTAGVTYTYHNFTNAVNSNYSTATVLKPVSNQLSLNIELTSDNNGTVVTTDWMDVVTLNFTIINPGGPSNLQWTTPLSTYQTAYDGDNSTLWTNGTYTNENTSPLPIELTSFSAKQAGTKIDLTWQTKTEVNNYGFEVERTNQNTEWKKIGFVKGSGNSNSPKDYIYVDNISGSGTIKYRLKQIDSDGNYKYSNEIEIKTTPVEFSLLQNYPNPFNPVTSIEYNLPIESKVTLEVFNILGEKVTELVNEVKPAGSYTVKFDGSRLSSGTYIYRMVAGNFIQIKKLILMK